MAGARYRSCLEARFGRPGLELNRAETADTQSQKPLLNRGYGYQIAPVDFAVQFPPVDGMTLDNETSLSVRLGSSLPIGLVAIVPHKPQSGLHERRLTAVSVLN